VPAAELGSASAEGGDPARHALRLRRHVKNFQYAIGAPERCPVPVIAAVNGACIGLGMDIISFCDVRYASSDSIFSIREADVGLAADIGTLAYLPNITSNESLARELAFTASNFDAATAVKAGLVSKVVDGGRDAVVAAAVDLAKVIASKSPVAIIGTKRLLNHARDHSWVLWTNFLSCRVMLLNHRLIM
jgi:Delta3,5-Delta2,4-dienoyl-CoA isomerase